MALKDWKKIKGNDRWWKDKPKYQEIHITSVYNGTKYAVFINNISPKNNIKKTKSQALAFAKKYMRSH